MVDLHIPEHSHDSSCMGGSGCDGGWDVHGRWMGCVWEVGGCVWEVGGMCERGGWDVRERWVGCV